MHPFPSIIFLASLFFSEIVHKKKWSTDEKASGLLFFPCLLSKKMLFFSWETKRVERITFIATSSPSFFSLPLCFHHNNNYPVLLSLFLSFWRRRKGRIFPSFSLFYFRKRDKEDLREEELKILFWKQLLVFHNLISLLLCLSWFFNSFLANLLFLCLQSFLPVSLFVANFGWRNFPIERMITKDSSNFSARLLLIFESKFLSFPSSSCPDFCF